MRVFLIVLACCVGALVPAQALAAEGLKVIVVDGAEAANIVAERIAAEPVIEVRDRDDRRVPNAVVRFLIRKTARNRLAAVFRNGQPEIRTLTDQAGRATADFVTPLEPGSFDIDVQVSYRGETAKATIRQTNYATTADAKANGREPAKSTNPAAQAAAAAAAPPAAGGSAAAAAAAGGGMSKVAVIGLVAGGAAGAGAAVVLSQRASDAPAGTVSALTASVTSGLQSSTAFAFFVQATNFQASSLAYRWDFGDGATSTDPAPTHVYAAPGSYTVVVTVSDARQSVQSQAQVTVQTMTGTWTFSLGNLPFTLNLTQAGSTISGTEAADPYSNCAVTGSVQSGTPAVVLTVPRCPHPVYLPHAQHDYRLDLNVDGQTLRGTMTYEGGTTFTILLRH